MKSVNICDIDIFQMPRNGKIPLLIIFSVNITISDLLTNFLSISDAVE